MKLGLDAMRVLVAGLGNPGLDVPTVLVTGTNGKGSTAAMTAAILQAAGLRTLLYTSPHVASVRERIQVNGAPIGTAALARRLIEVRACIRRLRRAGSLPHHPTFFEVLTAVALLHGRARRVEAAVLEIGLGGLHDATNIVPERVAVVTNVDLDHAAQLGHTLARVGANKAGIIKGNGLALTADPRPATRRQLAARARQTGALFLSLPAGAARHRPDGTWDLDLAIARRAWTRGAGRPPVRLRDVRLGMRGIFQGRNAALACAAAAGLAATISSRPVALTARTLRRGLANARLPGRFEMRRAPGGRTMILDGAHNPAAVQRIAAELAAAGSDGRSGPDRRATTGGLTLLFGVMADKDAAGMAAALFPYAARLVLTRPRTPRALPPRGLLPFVPPGRPARIVADPEAALRTALTLTPPGGTLLACGSFYLLGDIAAGVRRWGRTCR